MVTDVAVIGLGRFGSSVAVTLSKLGCNVLGIDKDEQKVAHLMPVLAKVVQADAADEESLRALGVQNMDAAVVAIGHDLKASVLITVLLKEIGVKHVVCKAADELHGKVLAKIGADRVVFPEREMGARVARSLATSSILDVIELSRDVSILEVTVGSAFAGKSLRQLDLRNKYGVNVIAIKSGNEINMSPKADDTLKRGDVLAVVGRNEYLERLSKLLEP